MLSRHDINNLGVGAEPPPTADGVQRERQGRSAHRTAAVVVGALFIAGDLAAVLAGVVTSGILEEPADLARVAAHHDQLVIGALCVLAMGFFLAAIPVVMYPILRKHNPVLATGSSSSAVRSEPSRTSRRPQHGCSSPSWAGTT